MLPLALLGLGLSALHRVASSRLPARAPRACRTAPEHAATRALLQRWASSSFTQHLHDRILIVAAHPDDEALALGGALERTRDAHVLFLTTGSPRDERYARTAGYPTREAYAAARCAEAEAALAVANIPSTRIHWLSDLDPRAVDRELTHHLSALTLALRAAIADIAPVLVVTHAYEGDHQDHDAARYLVGAALKDLAAPPLLAEMLGYHAIQNRAGGLRGHTVGAFLDDGGECAVNLRITDGERATKRMMIDRYTSQRSILTPFASARELLRPALAEIDFTFPPHHGRLHYETPSFRGEDFRALVAEAEAEAAR